MYIVKVINTMVLTGIATTLLPNERTAHKTLGLSMPLLPMVPRYILEIMDHF